MAEEALFIPMEDSDPETNVCEYSMSNHFNTSEEEDDDVSFTPECGEDDVVSVVAPLRPNIAVPPLPWPLP